MKWHKGGFRGNKVLNLQMSLFGSGPMSRFSTS